MPFSIVECSYYIYVVKMLDTALGLYGYYMHSAYAQFKVLVLAIMYGYSTNYTHKA